VAVAMMLVMLVFMAIYLRLAGRNERESAR
jgi:hypothetical protein